MSFDGSKQGFVDTKQFRIAILEKADLRLGLVVRAVSEGNGTLVNGESGLLGLLDSTYNSDVPATNYALHLKALAFESARFICTTEQIIEDIIFETTRGEFLSQNISEFLFPRNRFPQTDSTDVKVRNFHLSIIEAYFGGSTKENIEKSLLKFLEGIPVDILESFLLARADPSFDEIVNKFTFDVTVNVSDPRVQDINKLQADIEFLLSIIKPAHTFFSTKLIFSEFFDDFGKGCVPVLDIDGDPAVSPDGFDIKIKQASTAICDVTHYDFHNYFYEDLRKPCGVIFVVPVENELVQKEITDNTEPDFHQAAPRLVKSTTGGQWDNAEPDIFHTRFGPFAKDDGRLADSVTDITVFVNGTPVTVTEIFSLSAAFRLAVIPATTDILTIDYNILKEFVGALITNDFDSVINNFTNSATELNYKTVLVPTNFNPTISVDPLEIEFKYKGFNLFNSSVLNCAQTLNLNEPGLRGKFNDFDIFKSFGHDNDIFNTKLNEGTTLFPVSLDKKDVWRRLPAQQFRMNNDEFLMNTTEDRLFGEIHQDSYFPFYSALELETRDNGGESGVLSTICEDEKQGLRIEISRLIELDFPKLGQDFECSLFTFPSTSGFPATGVNATGFTALNSECVIFGGGAQWEVSDTPTVAWNSFAPEASGYPAEADVDYSFGGDHGQMHMLIHDVHLENIPTLGVKDTSPDVIEDFTDIPYTLGPFTLNNFSLINDQIQFLNDPSKLFNLVFQTNHSILGSTDLGITAGTGSITSVINATKASGAYDLTGMTILGDKVFEIDETILANTAIGFDPGDVIIANYTGIHKMNDGVEVVKPLTSPVEIKFITSLPILELTSVTNITVGPDYDLDNSEIIGDNIINLDKSNIINSTIGFDLLDTVDVEYEAETIITEITPAVEAPGDFLKFQFVTPNEISEVTRITNVTIGRDYDLTDLIILGPDIVLLDENLFHNLLINFDSSDVLEAEYKSITGVSTITETATAVNSPRDFRFINIKPIKELLSLTNITKQEVYDITIPGKLISSSGDSTSENALDSNIFSKWESVGSDDLIPETLTINLKKLIEIDRINLVDHNWKDFNIQYDDEGTLADFSTPILETNFSDINSLFVFDPVFTNKIVITINETQIADEEKFISRMSFILKDIIELDDTLFSNQDIGLDFGDIVYSSSVGYPVDGNIEPHLTTPRVHNRSVLQIYPA